jgi:predicted DNA-binding transcriptional regulator YafY
MATNKNALIRYKILDTCFRNPGKKYFIEDLIEACEKTMLDINKKSNGISLRQIRDDIAFMKSKEGWDIELGNFKIGKKIYYRYVDQNFSINNMPLNELEINQLVSAIQILSQFKGMPQFEWINEIVTKLRQDIDAINTEIVVEFDNNKYLKGIEFIGELYNAIFYKKVLQIIYHPFENQNSLTITLHPYYLKEFNNRWFILGYNPENERSNWTLALDRIVSIKELKTKYKINKKINWHDYFEDMIGVTKTEGKEIEKIILHFYDNAINYVETKPLHGSQKSKRINNNTLEVILEVIINHELISLILAYSDKVKVISPNHLVKTIRKKIQDSLLNYQV